MVALPMTLTAPWPPQTTSFSAFCADIHSFVTGEPRDFKFGTLIYHSKSHPAYEKSSLKGAWSGSCEQFLQCGLRKFHNSKSSVYRWYPQLGPWSFDYDTYKTMEKDSIATRLTFHVYYTSAHLNPPTSLLRLVQDLAYMCKASSLLLSADTQVNQR